MQQESERVRAYGEALLALCEAADATAAVERQFGELVEFLNQHKEIGQFAGNPTVTGEGKREALDELFAQNVHAVLTHFVLIVLANGLFFQLPAIAQAFYHAAAEKRELSTGELESARPVSEEKVALIEEEVGRILGRSVQLRPRTNPNIMGGLIVRVGDFVIDGTIDHQLDRMRRGLLAGEA